MPFEIDPLYVIYLFVALAAGLFVEAVYLLVVPSRSYRKNINRRLKLMDGQPDREAKPWLRTIKTGRSDVVGNRLTPAIPHGATPTLRLGYSLVRLRPRRACLRFTECVRLCH